MTARRHQFEHRCLVLPTRLSATGPRDYHTLQPFIPSSHQPFLLLVPPCGLSASYLLLLGGSQLLDPRILYAHRTPTTASTSVFCHHLILRKHLCPSQPAVFPHATLDSLTICHQPGPTPPPLRPSAPLLSLRLRLSLSPGVLVSWRPAIPSRHLPSHLALQFSSIQLPDQARFPGPSDPFFDLRPSVAALASFPTVATSCRILSALIVPHLPPATTLQPTPVSRSLST